MTRSELYKAMEAKYLAGAKEHGGDLEDMSALDLAKNMLEEDMDKIFYTMALINKLNK